jgi:hypothetical protein
VLRVLGEVRVDDWELRSLALVRLAILERHAGRLKDPLGQLVEATTIMEKAGPWAVCRYHIELASTYKELTDGEALLAEALNYKRSRAQQTQISV